jgi:gliding motility-associated-like protein
MRHQHLRRINYTWYVIPCIFIFLLSLSVKAQAQTTAEFTADNWSGCGAVSVQFTNQSSAGTYSWDFGDGGAKSTLQNPGRNFNRPGVFNVTLTVTFSNGTTGKVTHTVTVYNKPAVTFTTTPTDGCTPLTVNFVDHSTPGDGTISSVSWDFGDGNGANGSTASYTYNTGGGIKATSIVTNSFGCTASAEQVINVKASPKVAFTSDNRGSCKAPVNVNFTNNTTFNSAIPVSATYLWDFGDGTTSTDQNPAHTYTTVGTYTVTLTATTADGCTQTLKMPDYIAIATMQADFTITEKLCSGTSLHFVNTTSPAPVSATWTFPDGTTQNTVDAVKSFPTAGTYQIIMHSTTVDGCDATITKDITVSDPPTAAMTVAPKTACTVPVNVQMTGSTTGATSWVWTFGDGTNSTMQNPLHQYTSEGVFPVFLVATNTAGCTATANDTVTVQRPKLTITGNPLTGCIPLDVNFTPNVVSADPVASYNWDFGDGTTSTDQLPKHTYTAEGNYTVTLTITTQGGCTQTATANIQAGTPVKVDFTVDRTDGCQPTDFHFTNESVPAGTSWNWTFEENGKGPGTSGAENPDYIFQTDGLHDVTLTVINNGCMQQLTKTDYINVFPPVAMFAVGPVDCSQPYLRNFIDQSDFATSTIKKWFWDFGDGQTSTLQSPSHSYTAPGTYTVTLIVDNGTCTSTFTTTVQIVDVHPTIHDDVSTICRNTAVTFNMDAIDPAGIVTYTWNFGDGATFVDSANAATKAITHVYTTAGTYTATLTVKNMFGCTTTSNALTVNVNGSTAAFTIAPKQCKDSLVYFTDNTTTKAGNSIVSWTWDFGDGSPRTTVTTQPINYSHAYSKITDYPVTLIVTDNTGCQDSVVNTVHIANIVANFSANSNIACLNVPFQFNNSSVTTPLTYAWDFGDGGTSTDASPTHTYTTPGYYKVRLDITGSTGCIDHKEIDSFLRVPNPIADFSFPPVSADACPPVKVQFTNNSTDYTSSSWTFGDGSTSVEQDPLHNYIRPGTYAVTLTVYSEGGCASPTIPPQNITISGPDGSFTVSPETGCWPFSTSMTAVSPTATQYIWDFGDGHSVTTATPNSPSYTYPQEGVYFPVVLLEDARGCKVPALGNPKIVADRVHADFSADVSQACDGGTVKFTDKSDGVSVQMGQPLTYAWSFGDPTNGTSTDQNPNFDYTSPATYNVKLSITSSYGCTADTTMPITIEPKPAAEVLPITAICAGKSVQLQGRDNKNLPNTKWIWTVNGQEYDQQTPPPITFPDPGIVPAQLTITTASGICSSTDSKDIQISPYPLLNAQPPTASICQGQSITLAANTDATGSQITWTDYKLNDIHSTNPVATPDVDTTYHVIAVNATGCTSEGDVKIAVSQPFTVTSMDGEVCAGLTIQLHAAGATSYKWSPADSLSNPNGQNPVANPSTTTTYTVVGYGKDACFTDTATATITVHAAPSIEAGPDMTEPVGSQVQILAVGSADITKVQWWPVSWLDCADCMQPVATPKQTTTYHVTATNNFGCSSVDDITIKMVCEAGVSWLPNTFTPNNDGQNDIFYIRGKGVKSVKSFRIFNRWGQVVFERTNFNIEDASQGWDGTFKGVPVNPDVFVYIAEMICDSNEEFTLKGNVMLLR